MNLRGRQIQSEVEARLASLAENLRRLSAEFEPTPRRLTCSRALASAMDGAQRHYRTIPGDFNPRRFVSAIKATRRSLAEATRWIDLLSREETALEGTLSNLALAAAEAEQIRALLAASLRTLNNRLAAGDC